MSVAAADPGPSAPMRNRRSDATDIAAAVDEACRRVAPLWPLRSFVAVNPFLGFASRRFEATCATLRRVAGIDMLMPRGFYRAALANGTIGDVDLSTALARLPPIPSAPRSVAALRDAAAREPRPALPARAVVATVAEVLDGLASGDRYVSRTAFMVDEISRWCAAYFDEGQAAWTMPGRALPPYAAWRAAMRHDRNPEAMGIHGFRGAVAEMPAEPQAAIAAVLAALGIPARATTDYLHRALLDIGGWAGYVRHLAWKAALQGRDDPRLVDLLAIRVVWGYALFRERRDAGFHDTWTAAMLEATALPDDEAVGAGPELAVDLALQLAYEAAWQRRQLPRLEAAFAAASATPGPRPDPGECARPPVQAAFCIDVRSEVFRRALETSWPEAETLGFAGFFGFPIEYVPIGQQVGNAQCPVLLAPSVVICETVAGVSEAEETEVLGLRLIRRRAAKAWKSFKLSAVSSFTYVETAGLGFAAKLLGDGAGLTRPVPDPNLDGLDEDVAARAGPRLGARTVGGRLTGFDAGRRIAMAEAVLRGMSMTRGFARLVLLVGHGSTTVNNPHAAGLDCGACGGHTGEANARVAAGILNDPAVRDGLAARGIEVPPDTFFVPGLHDTTTDGLRLFDLDGLPASHVDEFARLRDRLQRASSLARRERAARLGIATDARDLDAAVLARSRDWSQVRPEWGLAGNATFIAAPRSRTLGLDLGGRCFLHSYDWRRDAGFGVLELVMTAPMVVATWINLQYYGSTVNNRVFGSGNKTLHNVVGTLGVLQGNGGDLQAGLPWQSVHDGTRFVHEPLRLHACIEAPRPQIERVIARHESVRDLVENGWLHLYAIDDDGTLQRYLGNGRWVAIAAGISTGAASTATPNPATAATPEVAEASAAGTVK